MARSRPIAVASTPALVWRRRVVPLAVWPTLLLLAFYGAIYVQFASQLASFPFDLDQGEGYDAWSGWLVNLGQLPYSSNTNFPYYSSNYPPLWSYLVSIPMAWAGPGLVAARVVSTLSALCTAVVLGISARRLASSTLAGILAAGFFLASPYVFHTTPLARVNATALLAAVTGLWLIDRPTRWRVALASLAFLAALFTKQTTLDAVVAGTAWLAWRQWRLGVAAVAGIGGVALLGLAALLGATGGAFWMNVVAGNANPLDGQQLSGYLLNFALVHCVLLAMAAAQAWRSRATSPWPLYLVSASIAALGVAKWGAGESYFLGAIAAASVLAGAWAARHTRVSVCAALLLQMALLSHGALSDALAFLPDRGPQGALLGRAPGEADRLEAERLVEQIRRTGGPALSEDPSFAVAAGRGVIGNATHLRNLYQAGLWDPTPMVNDLRAHRYAIVVLNAELYPEPVLAAIGRFYFVDRAVRINGAIYHVFLPGTD